MDTIDKRQMIKALEDELAVVSQQREILEEREMALDQALASLQELVSLDGESPEPEEPAKPPFKRNAFAKQSLVEGSIQYLRLVGLKQTNRQVVDALVKGGKQFGAKSPADTLRSVLLRESEKPNSRIFWDRNSKEWGLTEWNSATEPEA